MEKTTIEMLWRIYDLIKSWVEYAEKKNAILFTIGGMELTALKLLAGQQDTNSTLFWITFLLLAFPCIIALISFYPRTKRWDPEDKDKCSENKTHKNLLFYGDIATCSVDSYISALEKNYGIKVRGDKIAEDICNQIVILAHIANSKFRMFKIALYLAAPGQIMLVACILRFS